MSLCLLEPIDWRLRPKHTISVCSFLFCYFLYFIFVYLYLLVNLLWRMNTFVKNQFKGLTYRFLSNHSSQILSVGIKEISAVNDSIKYINKYMQLIIQLNTSIQHFFLSLTLSFWISLSFLFFYRSQSHLCLIQEQFRMTHTHTYIFIFFSDFTLWMWADPA